MRASDYYQFQAEARGVHSMADVKSAADGKAYLYDRIVLPWLKGRVRIAELACGHGSFLYYLKSRGFQDLVGIDSSPEQIRLAEQVGVKVQNLDVKNWLAQQTPGNFDAIIAIDLIEHLSKDDFMDFLSACRRLLSEGGRLILRFPNGDSPLVGRNLFNDITHVWAYTPNCIQSLAQMHGYSSVRFVDESSAAIRDHRWLKVPLSKALCFMLRVACQTVTRERIHFWSPHLWASLTR